MQPERLALTASHVGPHAIKALSHDATGIVTAVFQSVAYVSLGPKLVAVTGADIEPGPLNLTTNAPPRFWHKTGLMVGQSARLFKGKLYTGGSATINLASAQSWHPPAPITPSSDHLRLALSSLERMKLTPPAEGYGRSIRSHDIPEITTTARALETLCQDDVADLPDLACLLGRGPGLTPAGDDFLGGMMIGFHGIGQPQMSAKIWSNLEPLASTRTGPISNALLTAASDGLGSDGLHRTIRAFLTMKNLGPALAELDQIGHSSGWDAFAGFILAIRTHANCARHVPS